MKPEDLELPASEQVTNPPGSHGGRPGPAVPHARLFFAYRERLGNLPGNSRERLDVLPAEGVENCNLDSTARRIAEAISLSRSGGAGQFNRRAQPYRRGQVGCG